MPLGVFLGSCAIVGTVVGAGAAGVLRGWVWMNELEVGGGEGKGGREGRERGRKSGGGGGKGGKGKERERRGREMF